MDSIEAKARRRPRPRYEEIADRLAADIRRGRLGANGRLPSERALMAQFGVGRSTVREALFALRKLGLVAGRGGAVAQIRQPSAGTLIDQLSSIARMLIADDDGMRNFQSARALFEIGVVREAALSATSDSLAAVERALEANRAAINDPKTFGATDVEFHYALAEAAGNPIYKVLHTAFMQWLAEQRAISARAGADPAAVYLEHQAIWRAVAERDAMAAQDAMQAHLDGVVRLYWAAKA
jgi:GntR family transcriptional regulator, sialic acid-inducible nan operon repressor